MLMLVQGREEAGPPCSKAFIKGLKKESPSFILLFFLKKKTLHFITVIRMVHNKLQTWLYINCIFLVDTYASGLKGRTSKSPVYPVEKG